MKNLKLTLLINLALFIQVTLPAQEHTISLKGKSLNLPDNPYQVVEVIDVRKEDGQNVKKSVINLAFGMIQTNMKKPLKMDDKLETSILSLFQSNFKETYEKIPLIIKVNKLLITDFSGINDLYRVIEINLDFYTEENGFYFHEFTAGHYKNSTAHNQSQNIDEMIVNAIKQCYTDFLHRMNNNWGYHQEISKNELQNNSLDHGLFMNGKSKCKKDAIYYSFNDFRDNLADTLTKFGLKPLSRKNELGYGKFKSEITEKGIIDVKDIWGVQYNSKLYIQVAGFFIPVIVTKDGYSIKNMTTFDRHNYARSFFMIGFSGVFVPTAVLGTIAFGPVGIFFPSTVLGLVGGGIGAGIGGLKPKIRLMEIAYKIDAATGMPVPLKKGVTKIYHENEIKDNNHPEMSATREQSLKAHDESINELTHRGNKVFIEMPDVASPTGEEYFVKALLDWGYWNVVRSKRDADFIIVYDIDEKMIDLSVCVTIKTIDNKEIKKPKYFFGSGRNTLKGFKTEKGVADKIVETYLMSEFK